jgi:hypothetical protein
MHRRFITRLTAILAPLLAAIPAIGLPPLGTALTYQGRLQQSGAPLNGGFDFQCKLFDALNAGVQIGSTQTISNVQVTDGLFTMSIDFGVGAFNGNERFLEIAVRPTGAGLFTTLSPRQKLTAAPYATFALQSNLTGSYGSAVSFTNTGNAFAGNGTNLTALSASNVSSGNLSVDHLPTGGAWALTTNLNIDDAFMVQAGENLVGIANSAPVATLSVGTDSIAVFEGTPGSSDCFVPQGTPGCSNDACESLVCAIDPFCCNNSWDSVCAGEAATFCHGHVGIGTTAPEAKLHIVGGADSEPGSGGFLVLGSAAGANISFDNNEIMARSNDAVSALFINNDGGNVIIAPGGGGNLGVGTSAPTAQVHATGSVALDRGAVFGVQTAGSTGGAGVFGLSTLSNGNGVIGEANVGASAFGIWGMSTTGDAGHFNGDVDVDGALSKNSGSFKIDHPLDPANKYLYHSFVESPDMMNVYNGNVITDFAGYATVLLPDWFETLNRDFRYQLTVVDDADSETFAMVKVVNRIADNQFTIRSSIPGIEVSWQVTGIRQDPWAEAHRIQVEVEKPVHERGFYRNPQLYGQPMSRKIEEATRPGSMTKVHTAEPAAVNTAADADAPSSTARDRTRR